LSVNGREMAVLVWSGIALLWVLSRPTMRSPVWNLVKSVFQPLIIGTLLGLAAWVAGCAWVAEQFGVWETQLINETVWWFLATGLVLWFSLPRVTEEDRFFRKAVQRVVALGLLGEVFINLVVLPFGIELFLVPFITILVTLEAFVSGQPEYAQAQKPIEWVSALIGLGLFTYVLSV
jgi:hypothetical protein